MYHLSRIVVKAVILQRFPPGAFSVGTCERCDAPWLIT